MLTGISKKGLAYRVIGEEHDPSIVLIHGAGLSMSDWPPSLIEKIVALGYRVIVFDHRGIGDSYTDEKHSFWLTWWQFLFANTFKTKIQDGRYTTFDIAEEVGTLLDELRIGDTHIIGFSMGGIVSQIIASSKQHRVLSLTLIATTNKEKTLPTLKTSTLVKIALYHAYSSAKDYVSEKILGLSDARRKRYGMYNHLFATVATDDIAMRGKEITAPTLVIHGKRDAFFQLAHGRSVAANIAQGKLVIIEEMSHSLRKGGSAQIESLVVQFLATVKNGN
jgi:pimeloyl-ACP methyl ester carboxylesterase